MATPLKAMFIGDPSGDGVDTLTRILKMGNYDVSFKSAPSDDKLASCLQTGDWDVILFDYRFPALEVESAVDILRKTNHDIPFLVVFGPNNEAAALRCMEAGAQDYIAAGNMHGLIPAVKRELQDVEDRRTLFRAEEALFSHEERFRSLVASANEAIITSDAGGAIVSWNKGAEEIFGYAEEEIVGKSLLTLIPERFREAHTAGVARFTQTGEPNIMGKIVELAGLRRDGSEFPLELSLTCWKTSEGIFYGGIVRDITDRKKAELLLLETNKQLEEALSELKRTQDQIARQERLRVIGAMASGIVHDFNNVLSSILAYSDILLKHPENIEDRQKVLQALQAINAGGKDAGEIVGRLREFYRNPGERQVFAPVDIAQLVEKTVSLTQPYWKSQALARNISIDVVKRIESHLTIPGNEVELREALSNLIINAVDAMPEGGTITIEGRADHGRVFLTLSDTGTGMTEEVRQRCLDPFFSTKGEKGSGLGLAMVVRIIQEHMGTIEVESNPGEGTTFLIVLPLRTPEARTATPSERSWIGRSLRALVVDDEPQALEALAASVQSDGHTVETAASGREGLEKFHPDLYDVVLTDKGMPGMSGERLAQIIKRLSPETAVILVTGFDPDDVGSEKNQAADCMIRKPVTLDALRQALGKIYASG